MKGGTIAVSGATGFIGHELCMFQQASGCKVIAIGRQKRSGPWDEFVCWEIGKDIKLTGVHTVFHSAGKAHALSEGRLDEAEYFRINTEGTRQILEAAAEAGVRRFVLFSSVKVMGEGGHESLDESTPCHPKTAYGDSKLAAEKLVLEGGYVPEPVVLRLSMVYGNTQKGNLPRMIHAVEKGHFPPLPETHNKRSMVHVDDVVRAAMLVAESTEAVGQTYIVTDGTPYSTRQIYAWICEALGKPVAGWNIPLPALKAIARVGDGIGHLRHRRFMFDSDALEKLIGSAWYSSRKLEDELGFEPKYHLRDSLPSIIRYLNGLHA